MKYMWFMNTVCCALLLAGCAKKNVPAKTAHVPSVTFEQEEATFSLMRQFKATVDGVECELCAQDAKTIFASIEGIDFADFVVTGDDYEHGYMHFCFDVGQHALDVAALDIALQKEGFQIAELRGAFAATPVIRAGKKHLSLGNGLCMPLADQQELHAHHGTTLLNGTIKKDLEAGTFAFYTNA